MITSPVHKKKIKSNHKYFGYIVGDEDIDEWLIPTKNPSSFMKIFRGLFGVFSGAHYTDLR